MRSALRAAGVGITGLAVVVGFSLISPATAVAGESGPRDGDPASLSGTETPNAIPNRYIVVAKGDPKSQFGIATKRNAIALATRIGVTVDGNYSHAINGFAAALTSSQLETVRNDASIQYVTADQTDSISGDEVPAPWDLDRIDQRSHSLNGVYDWGADGSGVTAFIIDSGIRRSHFEFSGRVGQGISIVNDGRGTDDCTGHGTHVAALVAGARFGVAKNTTVVPVRVISCTGQGSVSNLIAGIDWVTAHHKGPAVANVSLSAGSVNPAIDDAIARSVASKVTYVVAAGNQNLDACTVSPSRGSAVIAVGSTDSSDTRAPDSNWGRCVSVFAPGVSIQSAWDTSDSATAYDSGTSMASPHVAGLAALYLQMHPSATPAQVAKMIRSTATPNVVVNAGTNSPNRLAFVGTIQ